MAFSFPPWYVEERYQGFITEVVPRSLGRSMIRVTRRIAIDEEELHEDFVRASGPGGQHVNRVATAVKLRFDVGRSPSLPEDVRRRLMRLAGKRVTEEGELVIDARRFRSQERNRRDARERLVALIRKAAEKPKPRLKTKPTAASKRRRLEEKRRRSAIKRSRVKPDESA
jgi:ribosome-associated protein